MSEAVYCTKHYIIDWPKVKTLDDLKRILFVMEIAFEPTVPRLAMIRDLILLRDKNDMTTTRGEE